MSRSGHGQWVILLQMQLGDIHVHVNFHDFCRRPLYIDLTNIWTKKHLKDKLQKVQQPTGHTFDLLKITKSEI
jgi:hypothetical protein